MPIACVRYVVLEYFIYTNKVTTLAAVNGMTMRLGTYSSKTTAHHS